MLGLLVHLGNFKSELMQKVVILMLLLAAFIGCTKEEAVVSPGTATTNPPAPTPGTSTVDKAAILQMVNAVRTTGCSCGSTPMPPVNPVTWSSLLEQAALVHSQDMTKNSYFDHTGSDGSSAGDRITRLGYIWQAWGENIAMGYTSERAVMAGWLASEGHCKNIMNATFTEMGVARDGKYWSQEFGKPMR